MLFAIIYCSTSSSVSSSICWRQRSRKDFLFSRTLVHNDFWAPTEPEPSFALCDSWQSFLGYNLYTHVIYLNHSFHTTMVFPWSFSTPICLIHIGLMHIINMYFSSPKMYNPKLFDAQLPTSSVGNSFFPTKSLY